MSKEELIIKADKFNSEEIQKYNPDMKFLYDISLKAGVSLAKEYDADETIVRIALSMMDSKLPEASHLGKPKEHISMASDATKNMLKDIDFLSEYDKENIIKCVEEHHGVEKYFSIESEVVANADCYKFVHPKGVLYYASMLGRRFHDFNKELNQLEFKLNEKYNTISLPIVKDELESYYEFFQKIIDEARVDKLNNTNIFVLHSLNGDTLNMWGSDVKEAFNAQNIDVVLPKFPIRAESSYDKFKGILNEYLKLGNLNKNSIVICHSISNAYFIRFCKELNYFPKAYIAVAPGAVYDIPSKRNDYIVKVKAQAYCKKEQLDFIKNMNIKKYCLYSDEDEPKEEMFKRFVEETGSVGMYLKYYNHFDGYHRIYKIPELIELVHNLLKEK